MRTDEEILQRIESRSEADWLGTEKSDLVHRLPFDKAKPFLKPETTPEEWGEPSPRDRESIITVMLDYMPFAWGKANDCRGISAGRSMSHYMAWAWLAGDDFGELGDYEYYGKENLVRICKHYGWDSAQWDDGVRTNG